MFHLRSDAVFVLLNLYGEIVMSTLQMQKYDYYLKKQNISKKIWLFY